MGQEVRRRLTAQVERYISTEAELREVYPQHWAELAVNKDAIQLDPNYEAYQALDRAGSILLVTLRDRDRLAGYIIGFLFPALHYQTSFECFTDIFYVRPEYRGGWDAVRMFRKFHAELKVRQVNRWHVTSKDHKDSGPLLRRLGFQAIETHYSRMV